MRKIKFMNKCRNCTHWGIKDNKKEIQCYCNGNLCIKRSRLSILEDRIIDLGIDFHNLEELVLSKLKRR